MIFNGHTKQSLAQIDEITMKRLQTMYADGLIGNHQILTVLGQLTAGVFNYMRAANSPDYKLSNILGSAYDYIYPPLPDEGKAERVSNALKTFMTSAPGFKPEMFKVKNG